jgi:hypothetical protein
MRQAAEASRKSAHPPAGVRGRIRGVDLARAIAIVGMVMVHVGPTGSEATGALGGIYGLSHGRASVLFVLLAGLGVSLLDSDRMLDGDRDSARSAARRRPAWARLGFRAALLLPLGLALQLLDHGVLVIVQYYAVYFVVAAGAMTRPRGGRRAGGLPWRMALAAGVVQRPCDGADRPAAGDRPQPGAVRFVSVGGVVGAVAVRHVARPP